MPCNTQQNTINPPPLPPNSGISGLAPIQEPNTPPFQIPAGELEDLTAVFQALSMVLPGGAGNILKPNSSSNYSKDILDGAISILEKFMPFLYFYSFFTPVLNIILCVIEVICSIANPFKMRRAIRRLFRICLPDLLSMFPSVAIIAMLLSLLALIIALIEYLIQQLENIIKTLLLNLETLSKATHRLDNDSTLAISAKIGELLCILQNLFIILSFVGLIVDVIKSILNLVFRIPPCSSSGAGSDDCCSPDVCPAFFKNNETITRATATFKYLPAVSINSGTLFPPFFPPVVQFIRNESWQFFDLSAPPNLQFYNITAPYDLTTEQQSSFFPQGKIYTDASDYKNVEFTVNMRIFYDPAFWGRSDPLGARFIKINNTIVSSTPYQGYYDYNNSLITPSNGTFALVAGMAFEDDGITPILIDGIQAKLSNLIHLTPETSSTFAPPLLPTDGYTFENVEYTFTINYDPLISAGRLVIGCLPDVSTDKDFVNAAISSVVQQNTALLGALTLPDVNGANSCISTALATYRTSISVASTAVFQATINSCLNTLKNDTISTMTNVILIGFDQNKSSFILTPTTQFTSQAIEVSVFLKDGNGILLTSNLDPSSASQLATQLKAITTLGSVDSFVYDSTSSSFIGQLKSKDAGDGTIEIQFNNKLLTILSNPNSINTPASISINTLSYKFINSNISSDGARRDESDVARDVGE